MSRPLPYNLNDLVREMPADSIKRGAVYQRELRVKALAPEQGGALVNALVQGGPLQPYRVRVLVTAVGDRVRISGHCNCQVAYNCKHVAAVLLEQMERHRHLALKDTGPVAPQTPPEVKQWLERINAAQSQPPATPKSTQYRLHYVLTEEKLPNRTALTVTVLKVRIKKNGEVSSGTAFELDQMLGLRTPPQYATAADITLSRWLWASNTNLAASDTFLLDPSAPDLLPRLIQTQRCMWGTADAPALSIGAAKKATFSWQTAADATQQLLLTDEEGNRVHALPTEPPWYLDESTHACGPLITGLPPQLARAMLEAPPLRAEEAAVTIDFMAEKGLPDAVPTPNKLDLLSLEAVEPVPELHFVTRPGTFQEAPLVWYLNTPVIPLDLPIGQLSFRYNTARVAANAPHTTVTSLIDGSVHRYTRNIAEENSAIHFLMSHKFAPLKHHTQFSSDHSEINDYILDVPLKNLPDSYTETIRTLVPQLRMRGWNVTFDQSFPYQLTEFIDDWYVEFDSEAEQPWFDVELGVKIGDEHINILPVIIGALQRYLHEHGREGLRNIPEEGAFSLTLDDGRTIAVPMGRVRTILGAIIDLYDPPSMGTDGKLRLPRTQLAAASEIETTLGANSVTWSGSAQLRQLGQQLRDFTRIEVADVPAEFLAELRGYQQEGVNWLQFLRRYELGGILADDMGLGKTVQALAHICIEKAAGRLDRPCLVVAPTSLIPNWRNEATRFAPHLRVLAMHGPQRKMRFGEMTTHDILLTTYPLLHRDAKILLAQKYHLVILDEAQNIKNPKAHATQVAQLFDTRHRLCLSGTPLENHLGEVWSLFNFLLPGYLGDEARFKRNWRTPIEKNADKERQKMLSRRIAPFLLRRTKDNVAKELPAKTEITRSVELDGTQRDLYESIRLAMNEKVRREISKKGLARSRIVILEALLKLRQVCCDPRLLKQERQYTTADSAKLTQLLEMLTELIEEGRRVLLFSQFTSMLAIIESEIQERKIPYVKLTGQTQDRATPVATFQAGQVPLFLISLKAGGTGLNLTAADTVIHYDPWWNPAVESQATDRAYRIGQDKPVFVYRLMTEGTVEEKINALQQRKRALADALFDESKTDMAELTLTDLDTLFEPLQ